MDDTFQLYDLKVEVVAGDKPMVCSHHAGDYFLVQGENLIFPANPSFSMYALAALIPILPEKQRVTDPNCGARFRITRIGIRTFHHSETTVVKMEEENNGTKSTAL